MKLYLTSSLIENLLNSSYKKNIGSELETLLHEGNRFYTSVYSLLTVMNVMRLGDSEKWRTILHLVGELVEEILPIDKSVLEIACEMEMLDLQGTESSIAKISGMDELIICEAGRELSPQSLPLRNFFRKTN